MWLGGSGDTEGKAIKTGGSNVDRPVPQWIRNRKRAGKETEEQGGGLKTSSSLLYCTIHLFPTLSMTPDDAGERCISITQVH